MLEKLLNVLKQNFVKNQKSIKIKFIRNGLRIREKGLRYLVDKRIIYYWDKSNESN